MLGFVGHIALPCRTGQKVSVQGRASKALRYLLATGMGTPEELARRREAPSRPPSWRWQLGAAPMQPGQGEGRSPEGVHPVAPWTLAASGQETLRTKAGMEVSWRLSVSIAGRAERLRRRRLVGCSRLGGWQEGGWQLAQRSPRLRRCSWRLSLVWMIFEAVLW